MSEIAKCPFCGEEPDQVDHGWNSTCDFYECCGVLAEEEQWNKIAAAMELAKLTVQMKTCRAYCPERAFLYAQDRVLEVFK